MFHSQSLSRKGPLAAIWVAAYCHKRLKKSQVTATDIPYSVDMIMQDELEVVTYRVLGYFLLGIVRIYSKKVEYLFSDCNKVLIQVKGFVFSEAKTSRGKSVAAPVSPITLPKRFELDAFELDVVDDDSGGNQVSPEDITLRDDMWITERVGHYSLHETQWEDVTSDHHTTKPDYYTVHDVVPLSIVAVDAGESGQLGHEVQAEIFTAIPLLETCPAVSSVAEDSVRPDAMEIDFGEATPADQSNYEAFAETLRDSNYLEEEHMSGADHNDVAEAEGANQDQNNEMCGPNHFDESMTAHEAPLSEKEQMPSCEEINLQGSIENLCGNVVLEKENANLENEMNREVGGETPYERENVLEATPGTQNLEYDDLAPHPTNLEFEATPLKQTDEQGARTPDSMLVPTPALKERSRTKRKRRNCLFDETIVLPNSVIKRNINNYDDLVCKRKKVPHDALSIWRARRAPNFFLDPLINYSAPELLSLFDEEKMKVSRTLKDAKTPSIPEPVQDSKVANNEVIPLEDIEVCREVNVPKFQHENELEGIAPETPMRQSPTRRPFQSPNTAGFDEIRPESPTTDASDEMRSKSLSGAANLGKETSFLMEGQELSFTLMHEEASSSEGDHAKLYGWTGRTRSIMKHLDKTFTKERNSSKEEVVSLMQICKGRTREESATLFYEILVLKSRGFIEVEQKKSYGDVLVRKKVEA